MNNEFNKAMEDENLKWFEINCSKIIADNSRKWIVISNKKIVKVGNGYQEIKEFKKFYSKEDINCIDVHCMDLNLPIDLEKSNCFICTANSINNYDNIQTENL